MSPEIETALTVGMGGLVSGVTAVLANTRAVRQRVRKLERKVKALGGQVETLERGQVELHKQHSATSQALAHVGRRVTWLMGAIHALLGALRLRGTSMPVALDAESTSGMPNRPAPKAG